MLQQIVGPHHEVALLVALDGNVCHFQVAVVGRWKCLIHLLHLKGIFQRNGIEDGFQIVVTVGTLLYDVEPQVDLGYWECYHTDANVLNVPIVNLQEVWHRRTPAHSDGSVGHAKCTRSGRAAAASDGHGAHRRQEYASAAPVLPCRACRHASTPVLGDG